MGVLLFAVVNGNRRFFRRLKDSIKVKLFTMIYAYAFLKFNNGKQIALKKWNSGFELTISLFMRH